MIAWSAHVSLLFGELPFRERPGAAGAAGFRAIESWWPPPGEADRLVGEVERLGLSVVSVNSDCGDVPAGDRGFLNVPERRTQVVAAIEDAVALAERLGARYVNVPVGRELPGEPRAAQLGRVAAVLADAASVAAGAGVVLLVEPINVLDVPGYLLPDAEAAAALIAEIGSPSVRLLYDAYHAARAGFEPGSDVRRFAPLLAHVQYADCPGRGAPGTGRSDLRALLEGLAAIGYEGAIGLEYEPRGPTTDTLGFLRAAPPYAPFPAAPTPATATAGGGRA